MGSIQSQWNWEPPLTPNPIAPSPRPPRASSAFSLIELLLAITIMTVIVGALYGIFHHTQRALRANVTQTDVLEGGRSVADLLTRSFSQIVPSDVPAGVNLMFRPSAGYDPRVQSLMIGGETRTNVLFELYCLTRYDREYECTLYKVLDATNGVGTLARISTNIPSWNLNTATLAEAFATLLDPKLLYPSNSWRWVALAEGVLHFRVDAFDGDGYPLTREFGARMTNRTLYPNVAVYTNLVTGTNVYFLYNVVLQPGTTRPGETESAYLNSALPTTLEIELGLLEPKALDQLRAFAPGSTFAEKFLTSKAAQVHLFRQRIPLRQAPFIQAVHP
jgi:hypothetical protein